MSFIAEELNSSSEEQEYNTIQHTHTEHVYNMYITSSSIAEPIYSLNIIPRPLLHARNEQKGEWYIWSNHVENVHHTLRYVYCGVVWQK